MGLGGDSAAFAETHGDKLGTVPTHDHSGLVGYVTLAYVPPSQALLYNWPG